MQDTPRSQSERRLGRRPRGAFAKRNVDGLRDGPAVDTSASLISREVNAADEGSSGGCDLGERRRTVRRDVLRDAHFHRQLLWRIRRALLSLRREWTAVFARHRLHACDIKISQLVGISSKAFVGTRPPREVNAQFESARWTAR